MHVIQRKILDIATKRNIAELGLRKLGALIGVDHPQKVKWHLEKLLRDGKLVKTAEGRPIPPNQQPLFSNILSIPILGRANCGEPLQFADEIPDDSIQLSKGCLGKSSASKCFAVKAVGESMNQASIQGQNINDGDIVIVDSAKTVPRNGDIILVSVDGLATIKQFYFNPKRQRIALKAQSSRDFNPILIHASDKNSYQIHGQVIDVVAMNA